MIKQLLTVIFCLGWGIILGQTNLERVEPPFWWAGMQSQNLQLLVYGSNISSTTPSIDYPGVTIEKIIHVKSGNYLFVDLKFSKNVKAGNFPIHFNVNGKTLHTYPYELKKRKPGSANREGFDASDVIYLITPDRFANGDESNDYVEGMLEKPNRKEAFGRHGGDIQGLVDHLDYMKYMGFTGLWLNPILENDQYESSYHGYATTDYYKVDKRFGSNEEYVDMSLKASQLGLKLIMDMIANHCGSEHWWMKDPPSDDWINNQGSYVNTNHRKETLLDPYGSAKERSLMVDGWFVPTMPDLNQRNELMATYLIQNSIWWVEYAYLAGIRQDTYSYPDRYFMADWTCALRDEYPNLFIVGEEWVEDPSMVAYWQQGKENVDGYTSCLPSLMDFPLNFALRDGLKVEEQWGEGLIDIYRSLSQDYHYSDPSQLVIFPDNHDMSRIFTIVNEDVNLLKIALAHTLTTRGIPQLYYGTEILMSNPGTDSHGIIRSDFPGGWEGDTINAFRDIGLTTQAKDVKEYTKKLLDWRKTQDVIHNGKLMHFTPNSGLYVYFRYNEKGAVMVVLNKAKKKTTLDMTYYSEVTSGYSSAFNIINNIETDLSNRFPISEDAVAIFELK
jgi:glycosidase